MCEKVLFVCVENSCRSQIAEGWAKKIKPELESYSCGSRPADKVNSRAIEVMEEAGVDISNNSPKGYEKVPHVKYNLIISMGCGDRCPSFPAKKFIEWDIPDPKDGDLNFMRGVTDRIKEKILQL